MTKKLLFSMVRWQFFTNFINILLEPVNAKTALLGNDVPFLCPTEENPFLATTKNSGNRAHQMQSLRRDYFETMARMARTGPVTCPI